MRRVDAFEAQVAAALAGRLAIALDLAALAFVAEGPVSMRYLRAMAIEIVCPPCKLHVTRAP
jgi:hypothetical protein